MATIPKAVASTGRAPQEGVQRTFPFKDEMLERIVAGATAYLVQFDGPLVYKIGDTPYFTLCSGGLKAEGESTPSFGWREAIERYEEHLRTLIAENKDKQLAWRRRPRLECRDDAQFFVMSRLAFI